MKRFALGLAALLAGCASEPVPPPAAWISIVPETPGEPGPDLSASPLRLEDVLREALSANAGLRAAAGRWRAARARTGIVTALPDPSLSFSYFIEEVVTRNGAIEGGGRLQQTVPWPGKLSLKGEIAEHEAFGAWERYMDAGLRVIAETKEAYYELSWVRESRRITDANRIVVDRLKNVAQVKYAAGRTTQQDVLRAEMEGARLAAELESLADLESAAREQLNRLLNRPPSRPLGDPLAPASVAADPGLDALVEEARRGRPRIREARRAVERSEAAESLADLAVIPDVTFGVEYSLIDDTSLGGAPDPGDDAWGVSIGITLPLWAGRNSALRTESRERLHADRRALLQAEFDTRRDVARLHYRLKIARRQVRLHETDLLPRARQALSVSETAYAAVPSRVDFDTVIENQQRVLQYELSLARSRTDAQQHRAALEEVVGRPFEGEER